MDRQALESRAARLARRRFRGEPVRPETPHRHHRQRRAPIRWPAVPRTAEPSARGYAVPWPGDPPPQRRAVRRRDWIDHRRVEHLHARRAVEQPALRAASGRARRRRGRAAPLGRRGYRGSPRPPDAAAPLRQPRRRLRPLRLARGAPPPRTDSDAVTSGVYARDFRAPSTLLTRALGRPIRDQVTSVRAQEATTLQALELVNGEILTDRLMRGARRHGRRAAAGSEEPLQRVGGRPVRAGTPDGRGYLRARRAVPDRVRYRLERAGAGAARLDEPAADCGRRQRRARCRRSRRSTDRACAARQTDPTRLPVKNNSRLVYDIAGKGFTRLRGSLDVENDRAEIGSTLNPSLRFFVFDTEPNMERLLPPSPELPMPAAAPVTTVRAVVDRIFWSALGRAPSAAERQTAEAAIADPARPGKPSPDGDRRSAVGGSDEAGIPVDLLESAMSADHENLEDYRLARRDELNRLSREERAIYSKLSRRGFVGATAAATLASLVGYEPTRLHGRRTGERAARHRRPTPTADAVIVLWMAGGMASTETFDPKRYTPFAPGVPIKDVLSTFPSIDTSVDHIKFTRGARADRQRDGQGLDHPHLHRRGPRLHPALAAPVSLAHRLHPAAAAGDAAHRIDHLPHARAEERRHAGVRRHRPDGRRRRRDRHAEGVPHRRLPRHRSRSVPHHRSAGRGVGRAAAEGARRPSASRAAASCSNGCSRRNRSTSTAARSSARRS